MRTVSNAQFVVDSAQYALNPTDGRLLRVSCTATTKRTENKELVFVIDVSGSMYGKDNRIDPVITAIHRFLFNLTTGTRYTLILFGDSACTIAKNVEITKSQDSLEELKVFNYLIKQIAEKDNPLYIGIKSNLDNIYKAQGKNYSSGTSFEPALREAFAGISIDRLHRTTVLFMTDGDSEETQQYILGQIPSMLEHQKTQNNEELIIPRMLCIGIGANADPKGILAYLSRKTKQPFFRIQNGEWQTVQTICSQLESDFYIGVRTPSADLTVTTEYGTETFKLGQHVYGVPFGATFYIHFIAQQCRIEVRFKESDGTSYIMYQEINPASIYNHLSLSEQGLLINANWLEQETNKLKGDYGPEVQKLPTLNEQFAQILEHSVYGNTNSVTGTENMTIL